MKPFPKLPPEKRRLILTVAAVTIVLVLLAVIGQSFTPFLGTQVAAPAETQKALVGGLLNTSPLTPGEHTITFEARTRDGEPVRAETSFVVATPPGPPPELLGEPRAEAYPLALELRWQTTTPPTTGCNLPAGITTSDFSVEFRRQGSSTFLPSNAPVNFSCFANDRHFSAFLRPLEENTPYEVRILARGSPLERNGRSIFVFSTASDPVRSVANFLVLDPVLYNNGSTTARWTTLLVNPAACVSPSGAVVSHPDHRTAARNFALEFRRAGTTERFTRIPPSTSLIAPTTPASPNQCLGWLGTLAEVPIAPIEARLVRVDNDAEFARAVSGSP